MDTREALITNLKTSAMVCGMYLEDLTDEEAMQRPHPNLPISTPKKLPVVITRVTLLPNQS